MDSKTVIYTPDNNAGSMVGLLAPLFQKSGIDPNILPMLMSMCGNNGFGGGGFSFIWVLFLFFLLICRGGFGGNGQNLDGIRNLINNDAGREMLMQAITNNGNNIGQLATNLNCSIGQVQQAINALMSALQGVGNQVGLTSQQVINAIQMGNNGIASQLAQCCCDIRDSITQQGNENRIATLNQTNTLVNTINANNQAVLSKLGEMQTQGLYDKIDALREKNTTLVTQLNNEHQTLAIQQYQAQIIAPVTASLNDLSNRLAKIECAQPPTFPMPYCPASGNYIPVNYGLNVSPVVAQSGCVCGGY